MDIMDVDSALDAFPVELLMKIFSSVRDLAEDESIASAGDSVLAMSQVCRHWRTILFRMPELWHSVALTFALEQGLDEMPSLQFCSNTPWQLIKLLHYALWAQSHPLSVRINLPKLPTSRPPFSKEKFRSQAEKAFRSIIRSIFEHLSSLLHRLELLVFISPDNTGLRHISFSIPWPSSRTGAVKFVLQRDPKDKRKYDGAPPDGNRQLWLIRSMYNSMAHHPAHLQQFGASVTSSLIFHYPRNRLGASVTTNHLLDLLDETGGTLRYLELVGVDEDN